MTFPPDGHPYFSLDYWESKRQQPSAWPCCLFAALLALWIGAVAVVLVRVAI